jgi:hypothetical protein
LLNRSSGKSDVEVRVLSPPPLPFKVGDIMAGKKAGKKVVFKKATQQKLPKGMKPNGGNRPSSGNDKGVDDDYLGVGYPKKGG